MNAISQETIIFLFVFPFVCKASVEEKVKFSIYIYIVTPLRALIRRHPLHTTCSISLSLSLGVALNVVCFLFNSRLLFPSRIRFSFRLFDFSFRTYSHASCPSPALPRPPLCSPSLSPLPHVPTLLITSLVAAPSVTFFLPFPFSLSVHLDLVLPPTPLRTSCQFCLILPL